MLLALTMLLAGCQCGPSEPGSSTTASTSSSSSPVPTPAPTPVPPSTTRDTGSRAPTGDTGRPRLGPPDVSFGDGGDATYIGLLGRNLMADVIGDERKELIIGGAHSQTFIFEPPITSATTVEDAIRVPGGGRDVYARDIDGDGREDLILSHSGFDSNHSIHLSPFDVAKQPVELHSFVWTQSGLCATDANDDGYTDLITHQGKVFDVYYGPLLPGEVIEAPYPPVWGEGDGVRSLDLIGCDEDITGDGRPDLVGITRSGGAVFDSYPQPGETTYVSAFALPFESPDGFLPVFMNHPTEPEARAMLYPGLERGRSPRDAFRVFSLPLDPEAPVVVGSIDKDSFDVRTAVGDVDGDGAADFMVVGLYGHIDIFYGPLVGDRARDDWDAQLVPDYGASHVVALDVNEDGIDDLLVTSDGPGTHNVFVQIWFGPLPR